MGTRRAAERRCEWACRAYLADPACVAGLLAVSRALPSQGNATIVGSRHAEACMGPTWVILRLRLAAARAPELCLENGPLAGFIDSVRA